ncbi:MAG: hypothetical protein WAN11_24730 [Syntrophobacteraceae bacterium]
MGTNADFRTKADTDYEKRSRDKVPVEGEKPTQKIDRSQITFVFVTPLVWKDKQDWVDLRKKEGIWQDIVIIDGVDLQDWIETASAVNLQFAAELGLVPEEGLQTPNQAWEEWSHRSVPPASEELVVTGREQQERELLERLSAPPNTFTVRGDSPREAWGFALASIRRLAAEDQRENLYARTLLADNENVAGRLVHLKNLVIILKLPLGQVSGILSSASRGCHVIIPEGNDAHSMRNVLVLPRPTRRQFTEALVGMRLSDEEAERAARACGRSVTILQRQRAHANYDRPKWAEGSSVIHMLPGLLAGRWNDSNEADRATLCRLAGFSEYGALEAQLQEFLLVDEPPLQKIGEMWSLTAPVDAFQLVAGHLTATKLERFSDAFREVFGRIDPKVEIPPDKWLYHDIRGEQSHSGWLRSGMAETLLLIAERGSDARLNCIASPSAYAERVVRGLPGLNNDWRELASLRDQYRVLIEAAPGPFLDSLGRMLEAQPDDVRHLFAEGEGIFSGGGMYTGLLWGLEILAWSPEYLPRVALILAKLARLDPGGRMANRPINTLAEIFLWWHPGTNATKEQKVAVIDLILNREPDLGWVLLTKLLPRAFSSISHPTAKPLWRDFGELPEDALTRRGQISYVATIIDRALDRVGDDPKRWSEILSSLRAFSPAHQEKVISLMQAIVTVSPSDETKVALWKIIRDFTLRHRSFRKAEWALPEELVEKLEAILPHLAPGDPVEQYRWLFDEWMPDLPLEQDDVEHHEQKVKEFRENAVRTILQVRSIEGLVELGTTCKLSGFVASTAAPLLTDITEFIHLLDLAISRDEAGVYFGGQISGQAEKLYRESWRELIFEKAKTGIWSPMVIAALLIWWPDERATWEYVAALGEEIAAEYWHRKLVIRIEGSTEDKAFQIERLIDAGRAPEVFDRISHRGEGIPTETLIRVFDSTLDVVAQAQTADQISRIGLSSYEVREYLDELRKRPDLPQDEIARREYRALPLLGLDIQGLKIHEFMAEDPNFFVGILCDVFLPAHRDKTKNEEPIPEVQARAQVGYRLLEGMDRIPGTKADGLDQEELIGWIATVREKATELDRAAIADLHIGKILAKSPPDPDDSGWPHQIIRNVLESFVAADIDRGLMTERYNMRGTFTKALYEGGAQERALASSYHEWANISRTRWPRVAEVLDAIAQGWEEDAKREDTRAEQDKRQ